MWSSARPRLAPATRRRPGWRAMTTDSRLSTGLVVLGGAAAVASLVGEWQIIDTTRSGDEYFASIPHVTSSVWSTPAARLPGGADAARRGDRGGAVRPGRGAGDRAAGRARHLGRAGHGARRPRRASLSSTSNCRALFGGFMNSELLSRFSSSPGRGAVGGARPRRRPPCSGWPCWPRTGASPAAARHASRGRGRRARRPRVGRHRIDGHHRRAVHGNTDAKLRTRAGTLFDVIDLRLLREDPEPVRASQRRAATPSTLVDDLLRADEAQAVGGVLLRGAARRAEAAGQADAQGHRRREDRAAGPHQGARRRGQGGRGRGQRGRAGAARRAVRRSRTWCEDGAPAGGEDDYVVLREVGDRPAFDNPRTTWSWASCSARSTPSAARRCRAPASTS